MPFGCSFVINVGIVMFGLLMVIVTIPSVRNGIATAIHCPGAADVIAETVSGGYANRTATTVTTLTCVFADGSSKEIANDTMFLTAVGGGVVISIVITLALMFFFKIRRSLRRSRAS